MTRKQFNLSRERLKRDMTQEQLAECVNITARTVRNHEKNGMNKLEEYGYKYFFGIVAKNS